jgi:SAM-dependent methyltransferase
VNGEVKEGSIACRCGRSVPIKSGIPRVVRDDAYVGNFSFEWTVHRQTQLDSANGTRESEERFAEAMDFPLADLKDKVVLDIGCGTGRFAEIVLKYGGTAVGIDLSYAVDAAYRNMGSHPRMHIVQADVFELPLKEDSFDLIYSLGVLHHTPGPRRTTARMCSRRSSGEK